MRLKQTCCKKIFDIHPMIKLFWSLWINKIFWNKMFLHAKDDISFVWQFPLTGISIRRADVYLSEMESECVRLESWRPPSECPVSDDWQESQHTEDTMTRGYRRMGQYQHCHCSGTTDVLSIKMQKQTFANSSIQMYFHDSTLYISIQQSPYYPQSKREFYNKDTRILCDHVSARVPAGTSRPCFLLFWLIWLDSGQDAGPGDYCLGSNGERIRQFLVPGPGAGR